MYQITIITHLKLSHYIVIHNSNFMLVKMIYIKRCSSRVWNKLFMALDSLATRSMKIWYSVHLGLRWEWEWHYLSLGASKLGAPNDN